MGNALYWVSALVYAIVLGIILIHDCTVRHETNREEKAFRKLLMWVIFFCLQDTVWGMCADGTIAGDTAFYISSTVFHLSTVCTTFFWLNYILVYLSGHIRKPKRLMLVDGAGIALQVLLLTVNLFSPVIFRVENGVYCTGVLRPVAFLNQYLVYLIIALVTGVYTFSHRNTRMDRYFAVFMFSLAPVLSGVFQLLYPYGPFYSMGYFLGCFIIHIFVVVKDREDLRQMYDRQNMERQIREANTDGLTGLSNRKSFEEAVRNLPDPLPEDFACAVIDVDGLKTVNDTQGHAAGDELLCGATECLNACLSAYGHVYRVGGDEFIALLNADTELLKRLAGALAEKAESWRGNIVGKLSLSVGVAGKRELPGLGYEALRKTADERMYRAKEKYHSRTETDLRSNQLALRALCDSYTKVLKVDLVEDTYHVLRMDVGEQTEEMGFSESLSEWIRGFAEHGQVHEEDRAEYLRFADANVVRDHFARGARSMCVFYRRKSASGWRRSMMELIPADGTGASGTFYLYVKDIDGPRAD